MSRSASIGAELMPEAGVSQEPPCGPFFVFGHKNASRQYAKRAFQYAHVLIEHHMTNSGAVEQRHHRRDQNHVIGANEFAQCIRPLFVGFLFTERVKSGSLPAPKFDYKVFFPP